MRELSARDFKAIKMEGVIHGWTFENERYLVSLTLCWDGVDVSVAAKDIRTVGGYSRDHVPKSAPSFDDVDVKRALEIANIVIQNAELTPRRYSDN